eukprot:3639009-Karenia_brevis.AAC.1
MVMMLMVMEAEIDIVMITRMVMARIVMMTVGMLMVIMMNDADEKDDDDNNISDKNPHNPILGLIFAHTPTI